MRAGQFRQESVAIQSATETRNNVGGVTQAWATAATVRARVRQMDTKERELYDALKVSSRRSGVFEFRKPVEDSADAAITLTTKHRIVWDSITWDIMDVQDDERHRQYAVFAVERTDPN